MHQSVRHRRRAGFTLVELMIVVGIVGVLAAIAVPSFRSYLQRSRVTEAVVFLGEIKQRQEAYRAEFGQYCNVPAWNPAAMPTGGDVLSFDPTAAGWTQLGAQPDGPTRFQYQVLAGPPGTTPPGGVAGYDGDDFWWVGHARGDLDADGDVLILENYSIANHIYFADGSMSPLTRGWE